MVRKSIRALVRNIGIGATAATCLAIASPAAAAFPGAPKFDGADTAWLLLCATLVLMMTIPGLALFYGGMVRRKNVLSTLMQSFILVGDRVDAMGAVRLQPRVRAGQCLHRLAGVGGARMGLVRRSPYAAYAATVPHQAFMIYQCMFADYHARADYRRDRRADVVSKASWLFSCHVDRR